MGNMGSWVVWVKLWCGSTKKRHGCHGSKFWHGWSGSIKLAWVEILAYIKKMARVKTKWSELK